MFGSKQSQNAGDNSQQLQANTINVINNNGITEQRAREIYNENYALLRNEMAREALDCANERVKQLEERLLKRISSIEGALNIFADPSYQILLTSAQKAAAASERSSDYDMLAELLACRIEKGESRKNRVGIGGAVEVIYNVDDDALCALTAYFCLTNFVPVTPLYKNGIQAMANIFDKLLYTKLPTEDGWLDHLDILRAIRVGSTKFRKFEDWYPEYLNGYTAIGIKKDTTKYEKSLELLSSINFAPSTFITNEFLEDYVKLPVTCKSNIKSLCYNSSLNNKDVLNTKLNDGQIKIFEKIWDLYDKDSEKNDIIKKAFLSEWDKYPSLKMIHDFYNNIPYFFSITQIGKVLAYSNIKRCDSKIPEMPLE